MHGTHGEALNALLACRNQAEINAWWIDELARYNNSDFGRDKTEVELMSIIKSNMRFLAGHYNDGTYYRVGALLK